MFRQCLLNYLACLNFGVHYTILTSNKSYSVSCTLNNCESSRIQVNVTVSSLTTPTASGASICAGNTATLTASGCTGTYNWYSSITGTAILVSTASYTTPILNTGKSYYVGCKINNCEGVRTQVIVTVDAIPTAPTSNGSSICSGSSTILTATGCSGTYRWYSSSTSTAILASTASYTTPLVVSNTSYFASCKVNNCESSRTQVNITIIPPPAAPVGTSASICSGSSAILSASGCTGIYGWYASNTSPTVLNSTANYTTAILSTNTGYFVSCKINNCESTRTQVFAIVTPATLTLSGNSPSGIQQATQKIFSTQTVNIGADAIYRAGNGITLNPGFSANISSVFLAEIVGCN